MGLAETIKKLSQEQNRAGNPVSVHFGIVMKVSPLEVNVDQKFTLDEDFLIVTEQLTKYEVDLKHKHDTDTAPTKDALTQKIVIREGLKVGDSVLLLRVQGGQQYVIWDKVVKS